MSTPTQHSPTPNPFALHGSDDPSSSSDEDEPRSHPHNNNLSESPSVALLRELQESTGGQHGDEEGGDDSEVFHSTLGVPSGGAGGRAGQDQDDKDEPPGSIMYDSTAHGDPFLTSASTPQTQTPMRSGILSFPESSTTPRTSDFPTVPIASSSSQATPTLPSDLVRGRRAFHNSSSQSQSAMSSSSYRSNSASPPPDLLNSDITGSSSPSTAGGQTRRRSSAAVGDGVSGLGSRGGVIPTSSGDESEEIDLRGSTNPASTNQGILDDALLDIAGGGLPLPVTTPLAGPSGLGLGIGRTLSRGLTEGKRSNETVRPPLGKGTPPLHLEGDREEEPDYLNEALARPSRARTGNAGAKEGDLSSPPGKRKGKKSASSRSGGEDGRGDRGGGGGGGLEVDVRQATRGLDGKQRAMWGWVNVVDLDGFLQEVYEYYVGKGIYAIILRRVLNLLTSGFVIVFSTFLMSCIDYSKFPSDGHGILSDVVVDQCASRWSTPHVILTWIFGIFFVWKLAMFGMSVPRLLELKRFYEFLLDVPNEDIQTVSWPEVVRRIGEIRQDNPTTSLRNNEGRDDGFLPEGEGVKLDAHDVANRIMRQENYLIALFNKDLLDLRLTIPIPSSIAAMVPASNLLLDNDGTKDIAFLCLRGTGLTQALEWNLRYCLMGELFDERGLVKKEYIRNRNRQQLVERLRRRFVFMGVLNALFAPFIVLYFLMYSFFRYFEEYHKNPSSIGSRKYTQYARWKFREFNELPHLFDRRLDESYVMAKQYIDQFPKELTALSMRFVAFIAGAFAAVLGLLSVIDPVFLHFEVTPNRTVLFYLGLFTSVLAVSRGMVPPANMVFDPELLMTEVVWYTHYMPDEWKGQLHSKAVHAQFGLLFQLKLTTFLSELLSVIITPFILWFSLPRCSADIVDFFREFTVHVDGLGYVCSFAVFDFKRTGNVKVDETMPPPSVPGAQTGSDGNGMAQARAQAQARRLREVQGGTGAAPSSSKAKKQDQSQGSLLGREGKMEKSFLHFKVTHPDWQPSDPSSSMLLSRLANDTATSTPAPTPEIGHLKSPLQSPLRSGGSGTSGAGAGYPSGFLGPRSRSADRSKDQDREKYLRDKSVLYEKALQRSIMLHGSGTTGSSGPLAKSKIASRVGQLPGADRFTNSRPSDSMHGHAVALQRMGMTTTMNGVAEEDEDGQQETVGLNALSQGEVEDGWLTKGTASTSKKGVSGRRLLGGGDDDDGDGEEGMALSYGRKNRRKLEDGSVMGLLKHVMGS